MRNAIGSAYANWASDFVAHTVAYQGTPVSSAPPHKRTTRESVRPPDKRFDFSLARESFPSVTPSLDDGQRRGPSQN